MTRSEIILELLKSLNIGNSSYNYEERVDLAIKQYNLLVEREIIYGRPLERTRTREEQEAYDRGNW